MPPRNRPLESPKPRVLHVLGALTVGGIETWLMHMLRHRDSFSVEHEVLLTKEEPGAYEEDARALGVSIHKLPLAGSRTAWLRSFRRFLSDHGPFDAVHSHVYQFSAPVLSAAKAAHVPVRIAHCHTARSRGRDHRTIRHKFRRAVAIAWLKRAATRRVGITEAATEEIAGSGWEGDPKASVLLYGFDFSHFRGASKRGVRLRKALGIDGRAPVIGHVGRFEPVKNHAFLLEAFAGLFEQRAEARLVLVGDGPVRADVEARARSLGLADAVRFPGSSDDVPAYMAMFDLFALPSFSEGLGIVCVEAQAAGTPVIASDVVPSEVCVIPGAVDFLPIGAGPRAWADAFARRLQQSAPDPDESLRQVEASRFGLRRCIDELDAIYRSELEGAGYGED